MPVCWPWSWPVLPATSGNRGRQLIGLVAPVLIAAVIGIASGGSLDGWARRRIRWWPLTVLALGIQLPLYSPPFNSWPAVVTMAPSVGLLTMALVLLVLVRNAVGAVRPACLLAALGLGLNLTVMLANAGSMPRAEELMVDSASAPVGSNTSPMSAETRLAWLADVIPQPAWLPRANLVSIGDLCLSFGAAWWAFTATRSVRRWSAAY